VGNLIKLSHLPRPALILTKDSREALLQTREVSCSFLHINHTTVFEIQPMGFIFVWHINMIEAQTCISTSKVNCTRVFLRPLRTVINWMPGTIADKTKLRSHIVANKMSRISTVITNHLTIARIKDLLRERGNHLRKAVVASADTFTTLF
jgi:hypothetical protein